MKHASKTKHVKKSDDVFTGEQVYVMEQADGKTLLFWLQAYRKTVILKIKT